MKIFLQLSILALMLGLYTPAYAQHATETTQLRFTQSGFAVEPRCMVGRTTWVGGSAPYRACGAVATYQWPLSNQFLIGPAVGLYVGGANLPWASERGSATLGVRASWQPDSRWSLYGEAGVTRTQMRSAPSLSGRYAELVARYRVDERMTVAFGAQHRRSSGVNTAAATFGVSLEF